jgi:protein-tyrosine kinase
VKTLKERRSPTRKAPKYFDDDGRIGKRLFDSGKLSDDDIGRIVATQRAQHLLFGEAAVELGLVTQTDLDEVLAKQFAFPSVRNGLSSISALLVAAYEPEGPRSEAIRNLRTELGMRWFNDQRKTIAVTSSRSGQGASTVAANLAISFAQLGERTLLIDANFRSPRQHELFGIDNSVGLSGILSGRISPNSAHARVAPFESLAVICAGPPPLNPQELLGRVTFSYLIETAPSAFDIVIIDSPPVLEFADAQLIIALAKGCILSTRRDHTTVSDLQSSKSRIAPTGATLVGAVLND